MAENEIHTVVPYDVLAENAQALEDTTDRIDSLHDNLFASIDNALTAVDSGQLNAAIAVDSGQLNAAIAEAGDVRSDILREIAALRSQMSALNDVIPGLVDAMSELGDQLSQVNVALSQLANAQSPQDIASARAAISQAKNGVAAAVDAAQEEAERTNAEVKSDNGVSRYEQQMDALQQFQDSQRRYMNELALQTEIYTAIDEMLDEEFPDVELTQEQMADIATTTVLAQNSAVVADQDIALAVAIDQEASPESQAAAESEIQNLWGKTREILKDPNVADEKKEQIRDMLQTWGRYPSPEAFEVIEKIADGSATQEEIDATKAEGAQLTTLVYSTIASNHNPPSDRAELYRYAREQGYESVEAYLKANPLHEHDIEQLAQFNGKDPETLSPEERITQIRGELAVANHTIRTSIQRSQFYEALGLEQEKFQEYSQLSHEELIAKAQSDPAAQKIVEFHHMSSEEKIDLLIDKGDLSPGMRDSALAMEYILDANVAHIEDEGERQATRYEMEQKIGAVLGDMAQREGESELAYKERMLETMTKLETDPELNAYGVFSADGYHSTLVEINAIVAQGGNAEDVQQWLEENKKEIDQAEIEKRNLEFAKQTKENLAWMEAEKEVTAKYIGAGTIDPGQTHEIYGVFGDEHGIQDPIFRMNEEIKLRTKQILYDDNRVALESGLLAESPDLSIEQVEALVEQELGPRPGSDEAIAVEALEEQTALQTKIAAEDAARERIAQDQGLSGEELELAIMKELYDGRESTQRFKDMKEEAAEAVRIERLESFSNQSTQDDKDAAAIGAFKSDPARYAQAYAAGDKNNPDYQTYLAAHDALFHQTAQKIDRPGQVAADEEVSQAVAAQMHRDIEAAYAQQGTAATNETQDASVSTHVDPGIREAMKKAQAVGVTIAGAGVTTADGIVTAAAANDPGIAPQDTEIIGGEDVAAAPEAASTTPGSAIPQTSPHHYV